MGERAGVYEANECLFLGQKALRERDGERDKIYTEEKRKRNTGFF